MENLARYKLTDAFFSAFESDNPPIKIAFPPNGNQISINNSKDVLFDLLIKDSKFEKLINQISSLLLGKSLLKGNKTLYDDTLKLYIKRNQFVHKGQIVGLDDSYLSGISEARKAIDISIQLVDWFGETSGYEHPLDKNRNVVCPGAKYN
jgi:hypothetical protein